MAPGVSGWGESPSEGSTDWRGTQRSRLGGRRASPAGGVPLTRSGREPGEKSGLETCRGGTGTDGCSHACVRSPGVPTAQTPRRHRKGREKGDQEDPPTRTVVVPSTGALCCSCVSHHRILTAVIPEVLIALVFAG